MPDRFANGNPLNDSHPDLKDKLNRSDKDGRHGGDLEGIIKNLDYIEELGATAIWSTPLCEDNDPSISYHTYGQSDFCIKTSIKLCLENLGQEKIAVREITKS